nr:phenylalanine--tRNA ligase subunit beta [Nanoarchaeota archaeon]
MPTIEVSYKDLCNLIGKKLGKEELEEALMYVKGEIDEWDKDNDLLKIETADTNRPDLWSAEGIAREIKRHLKLGKDNIPKIKKSGIKVIVDKNLAKIRPLTVCAVIRGLKITEDVLSQMIQLQEKVCETFGSKRREVAIGVYDLHRVTSPIYYKGYGLTELKFVPLEFSKKLNLRQILAQHPKGKEYGYLLEKAEKYPIFIDKKGEVLSMPPIINSDYTGKVTKDTKDLFIECSGFNFKFLVPALNVICMALVDRGGKLESVEVQFPDKKMITPDFSEKSIKFDFEYVNNRSGLNLKNEEIEKLLKKAGYSVKGNKVFYPAYRQDIMHAVDVIEDIIIGYGYNSIKPESIDFNFQGSMTLINKFSSTVASIMMGLGAQEVMNYTLTNKDILLKKMLVSMNVIEVDNPVSMNWVVFRTWVLPGLLEFLSKNTNKEYPQQIFEIGEVVVRDDSAETKSRNPIRIVYCLASKDATFTNAKQVLEFLFDSLGITYVIDKTEHPSFIKGRCGRVKVKDKKVAYIGEINPQVLENFGIEMPVAGFELNLTDLYEVIRK